MGQTPLGLKVKRGGYRTLSLKMDGYAPVEKTVLGKQLGEKRSKNILKIKLTKLKTVIDASAEKTTPGESGKSQATPSGVKGQSDAARQANKRAAAGGAGPKKRSAPKRVSKTVKKKNINRKVKSRKAKKARTKKSVPKKKPDDDLVNPFE